MRNSNLVLIVIIVSFFVSSCHEPNKDPKATGRFESINSGTFTCYVDEAVWDLFQKPFMMYDSSYREIFPTFIKVSSRDAMARLLAGEAKVIITPRDYLPDEDSLMKAYKVKAHERAICAIDGLVFFTQKNYPLDTLTDKQIVEVLTNQDSELRKIYPILEEEPEFVINDYYSSEYAGLIKTVLKAEPIFSKITFAKNSKLVREFVYNNSNAIGIGFFSQVVNDIRLKCLSISFINDSSDKYVFPHVVHQANILRELYPYRINHYVYILEKKKNLIFWFATYMEREAIVQQHFLNVGIVPAYAKIKLIEE